MISIYPNPRIPAPLLGRVHLSIRRLIARREAREAAQAIRRMLSRHSVGMVKSMIPTRRDVLRIPSRSNPCQSR